MWDTIHAASSHLVKRSKDLDFTAYMKPDNGDQPPSFKTPNGAPLNILVLFGAIGIISIILVSYRETPCPLGHSLTLSIAPIHLQAPLGPHHRRRSPSCLPPHQRRHRGTQCEPRTTTGGRQSLHHIQYPRHSPPSPPRSWHLVTMERSRPKPCLRFHMWAYPRDCRWYSEGFHAVETRYRPWRDCEHGSLEQICHGVYPVSDPLAITTSQGISTSTNTT